LGCIDDGYASSVDFSAVPTIEGLPGIDDLRIIGRGGFATVYRGWQPAFHREVAVKVLDGGTSVARFQKEIRALGSLSGHPHVVPVYEAGTMGGRPFFVMPFLPGGSIQERLRQGPLPVEEVVELGIGVADALSAAHHLGILHRDIKPSNILRTTQGYPQLADFGIARFADATLTNGQLTATVSFAAPEVLSGQPATPLSDVYSLGATLYTALRGIPPFPARDGEGVISLAVRVMGEAPKPLVGVSPALAAVITQAMSKDPADRHPSAAALRDALKSVDLTSRRATALEPDEAGVITEVMAGEVPLDERVTPPDRELTGSATPTDRRGRSGRLLAGVVAALLILGAAAAVWTVHRRQSSATRRAGPYVAVSPKSQPTTSTVTATPLASPPPTTTTPPTVATPTSAGAGSSPTAAGSLSGAPTTAVPTTAVPPTTATTPTTATPSTTVGSSGDAGFAGAEAPTTVGQLVDDYYALVDQHRLSQSFGWLSSSYRQRIGFAYYQRFWDAITRVDVLRVTPGVNSAALTLRYIEANGSTSTENAEVTIARDAGTGRLLIDTYRVR
jgi:serine/threonine protein kinase